LKKSKRKVCSFWLSSSNKVIGFETISEGLLNSSLVHPREVFRGTIIATCKIIIIAHNRPSSNLEPSREDISIIQKLVEAGKIPDISVFHIIFTDIAFTSFIVQKLI